MSQELERRWQCGGGVGGGSGISLDGGATLLSHEWTIGICLRFRNIEMFIVGTDTFALVEMQH